MTLLSGGGPHDEKNGANVVLAGDDLRRELNDDRRQLFAGSAVIAFVCECANRDCYATVALSPDAFDLARQTPPQLLLAAGHSAGAAPRPGGRVPGVAGEPPAGQASELPPA